MSWVSKALTSTLGRKLIMALTALFLVLFLVVHLSGNLQLLIGDHGKKFNMYAEFMANNPLIKTVSILNFAFILIHILSSLLLTIRNRKARPEEYHFSKPSANSKWASRNMGILGTIILVFLVVHLQNFWYQAKFGFVPMVTYEGVVYKDLYTITATAFSQWWLVGLYVFSMIALGFHLYHGFQSMFQTMGINHPKYTPFIKKVGVAFSLLIPAGFALIPLYMYFVRNIML